MDLPEGGFEAFQIYEAFYHTRWNTSYSFFHGSSCGGSLNLSGHIPPPRPAVFLLAVLYSTAATPYERTLDRLTVINGIV